MIECTVVWWIKLYLDSPSAGILISTYSNRLHVRQLYILDSSKWRLIWPLQLTTSLRRWQQRLVNWHKYDKNWTLTFYLRYIATKNVHCANSTWIPYAGFSHRRSNIVWFYSFVIDLCIYIIISVSMQQWKRRGWGGLLIIRNLKQTAFPKCMRLKVSQKFGWWHLELYNLERKYYLIITITGSQYSSQIHG